MGGSLANGHRDPQPGLQEPVPWRSDELAELQV